MLKRRQQTTNAKDSYDASRSFVEPEESPELFRRRREDFHPSAPHKAEKRVKFEIVGDASEGQADPGGGYDPYGHSE